MASLQRTLGAGYEDFQPKLDQTETPEAHILQIHIPGFTRDQVKIRYVGLNKTLSISGEKPEGDNRWSRFNEAIPVPVNCEVNRLGAKFDKGVLTITMPKKFITPVVPKDELRTSEDKMYDDPSFGAAYEEFQPKVEKTENLDAYLFHVYLPGFLKDQVKIKYNSSSRLINISGERPIEGGRRWIRLDQAFPAPENFNEERLGAKFDQGILTITMPKRITSFVAPKEEFAMAEPKLQRADEEISPKRMAGVEGLKRRSSLLNLQEFDQEPSTGAIYEEFQPKSEITESPEEYRLKIHLPGFTREQFKIKYTSFTRVIRVSGERSIEGGRRWSRFDQAFPVPENFNEERLGARFDQGILTITLPRKITSLAAHKEEATMAEPKPQRAAEEIPSKPMTGVERLRRSSSLFSLEDIDQEASTDVVYEEFQPKSEVTESPEEYRLQIHLPGFTRYQFKIKFISSSRVIRISGERPIEGGRRWSRFDQTFPVPESFNEERLGARFDQGILTVAMPKKFTSHVAMAEPKPERPEEVVPPKAMNGVDGLRRSSSLLSLDEIDQKSSIGAVYEEFHPKSETTETLESYHLHVHLHGFTRDQVKIKYISSSKLMSVSGERPIEGGKKWIRVDQGYPVPENCYAERVRAKFDQGILTLTMPKKSIPQVGKEGLVPKPTRFTLIQEHAAPRTASAEAKRIEEIVATIGKGFQEVAASASNAVANMGDGTLNNEEKHLLSVVIAALGAYVSYRLTASGKPYNY